MKKNIFFIVLACLFVSRSYTSQQAQDCQTLPKTPILQWEGGRLEFGYSNKTEGFYSRSLALFSDSIFDQWIYFQDTNDFKIYWVQDDILRSRMVVRNKFRVGEPDSLGKTSNSTFKIADALTEGDHNHYVGKPLLWFKEVWAEFNLNKMFGLCGKSQHFFKIGLFPFALGRGISLGDAYAVSPGIVGFFSNNVIDQFAFGALFHGQCGTPNLEYDGYISILRNFSGSFPDVTAKIYTQNYDRKLPLRGFGHMNLLFAGRLLGTIKNPACQLGVARVEPYFMINLDPEQKVEFDADAKSKLATLGFSVEYEGPVVEWGLEMAANFGHQTVLAWDSNEIKIVNDNGNAAFQYTKVLNGNPKSSTSKNAIVTTANKTAVQDGAVGPAFNGKEINSSGLYNAVDRFTPHYTNAYKGIMAVADLSVYLTRKARVSTAVAYASGDANPNIDLINPGDSLIDGDYQGFIPFQSNYSGKTVISLFFLGTGRIARPLTIGPTGRTAKVESGFTNLKLFGFGADLLTDIYNKRTRIRPNIMFGWKDFPSHKFDIDAKTTTRELADNYLGFELNLFSEMDLIRNLKGFFVGGIFFPGTHFKDIKGEPLTNDQLDTLKKGGDLFDINNPPLLSTKKAIIVNIGLEYSF